MRWVALALLAGCSLNRSAEREDSFAQQGESRREEGPWTRETWEWVSPPQAGGEAGRTDSRSKPLASPGSLRSPAQVGSADATRDRRNDRTSPEDPCFYANTPSGLDTSRPSPCVLRHTIEKHDPVTTTSTTTVEASGEAKEARSARFGFAPWQWAIGGLVALAGLYGLFRLKGRLGL